MATSKDSILTAERARKLLWYEPETGKLFWRVNVGSRARAGTEAGSVRGSRYRRVGIRGHVYLGHRVVWLIVTGKWPTEEIDHISGDRMDNRWENLRGVSRIGNMRNAKQRSNNASGVTGVHWDVVLCKWCAQIGMNGTKINLGRFDNLATAVEARKAAECQYSFHENHGRTR